MILDKSTYTVRVWCTNCDYGKNSGSAYYGKKTMEIPKGCLIADFLRTEICPNCGCKTLKGE